MIQDDIQLVQQIINHGGAQVFDVLPMGIKKIIIERQWVGRLDKNGQEFTSFEAFATHRLWQGLEINIKDLFDFCRKAPDVRQLLIEEGLDPGRESRGSTKEERTNRSDNVTASKRGNSALYTIKRLKRERPDLAKQVASGALSANAAAIKAGWRKPPSAYERILKLLPKLTAAERRRLKAKL